MDPILSSSMWWQQWPWRQRLEGGKWEGTRTKLDAHELQAEELKLGPGSSREPLRTLVANVMSCPGPPSAGDLPRRAVNRDSPAISPSRGCLNCRCYQSKLGSACPHAVSQSIGTGLWWRKVQCLLQVPSKESRQLVLKRPELPTGFQGKVLKDGVREEVAVYVISFWTFFWLVGGEVTRSQHPQPSGSNQSGVYVLVGSMQLTSPNLWGFQYLQNNSKDIAQNIIYSLWEGKKLSLFCLAWLFSLASAFSHFSD